MIRKYLSISVIVLVMVIFSDTINRSAHSYVSGPPAGNTGSPGDGKSCAQSGCHPIPASPVVGIITSNIPGTGYVPGNTYTITATVAQAGLSRFGFQISPQNTAGMLLGTLISTNTNETQIIGSGKYITHKTAGTTGSGSKIWSFDWIAPTVGSGSVTFYGAFNFANNNGNASGDNIRLSSLQIDEEIISGLSDNLDDQTVNVYPNPVFSQFQVSLNVPASGYVQLVLSDLKGKKVFTLLSENLDQGEHKFTFDRSLIVPGTYFINMISKANNISKKIVIF